MFWPNPVQHLKSSLCCASSDGLWHAPLLLLHRLMQVFWQSSLTRACCFSSLCQHHLQCGKHLLTIIARCKRYAESVPLLAMMQDPRIQRLPCTHSGTYADDCLCDRVRQHKCYIVATCDRDLRRRIRKVLYVHVKSQYTCIQVAT